MIRPKCTDMIKKAIFVIFSAIIIWMVFISGFSTANMDFYEHTYLVDDSILLNSLCVLLLIIGLWLLKKVRSGKTLDVERISRNGLTALFFALAAVIVLLQKAPRADQKYIIECCNEWAQGDYSSLVPGGYLDKYHNQLGIVFFLSILTEVFGRNNYLAFQLINAVSVVWIYISIKQLLSIIEPNGNLIKICCTVFGFLFFPMILYVNFLYGNIIGLACALSSLLNLSKIHDSNKYIRITVACLLMAFAVLLKQNYMIFCIGIAFFCLVEMIDKKRLVLIIPVIFCAVIIFLCDTILIGMTEYKTNQKIAREGISPWAYIAMGLQENDKLYDGWWNRYVENSYMSNDFSRKKQEEEAKEEIAERINVFISNPQYTIGFFAGKNASQWNNPTFQSIWINWRMSHNGDIEYADWISWLSSNWPSYHLSGVLNRIHFILLFGIIPYILFRKKGNIEYCLCTIFVGGFVFHTFWEAKGQYTLPFFLLLFPLSVLGWREIYIRLPGRIRKTTIKEIKKRKILIAAVITIIVCLIQGRSINILNETVYRNEDTEIFLNYLEDTDWARIGNGSFYIYNDEFRQFYIASSPSDKTSAEVFLTEKITEENVIEVLNDPQEKKVRFHFLSSNKYLDVPGGTVETDECLWAYRENGSSAQMWRILKQDDIYYIITQDNNGEYMALTIDVERKKIVLTPFNRTKQQSWRIKPL